MQCYNSIIITASLSRYCMRFIIFAKLSNRLTTGYILCTIIQLELNGTGSIRLLCPSLSTDIAMKECVAYGGEAVHSGSEGGINEKPE